MLLPSILLINPESAGCPPAVMNISRIKQELSSWKQLCTTDDSSKLDSLCFVKVCVTSLMIIKANYRKAGVVNRRLRNEEREKILGLSRDLNPGPSEFYSDTLTN